MKSAQAGSQRPRDPDIHFPSVGRATCQSSASLLTNWISRQEAGYRGLWPPGFPGGTKDRGRTGRFFKCKAGEQIEFTGSTLFFTISTEALILASNALPPVLDFPLWGSVTLLSSLELVFTPLTFRGRGGGGGRQTWLLGPCQTGERGWPWIN